LNYAGKFNATISSDRAGAASPFNVHVGSVRGHVPADAIVVPDAHFLFNADFKRSGLDLVLSGDNHEFVLHDYFKGEKRVPLASPDGAHLTGDLVTALTGAVDVSQAGAPAASGQVIGHVTKLVGSATVIRNGVSIILNMGENVEKGDVVQCGSDSTLGLSFIDGTVFGLSANARMVLNEMVYDPNGSNNSSLLSLVAGTITFVAGETAKHGDMKVDTPVATMGIRGTAVLVEIDFTVPNQNTTPDAHFQVLVEPDGHTGSYILFDKTTLQPIAAVNQAGQQINITNGVITQSSEPLPPDIQKLIQDVFTQKFSYNDTHTKTAQTDTLNPLLFAGSAITAANGIIAIPQFALTGTSQTSTSSNSNPFSFLIHLDIPPTVVVNGGSLTARTGALVDTASGTITFADVNGIDRPTATARFSSFTVLDPNHNDITSTLTAQQLAAIQAVAGQLSLSPSAGNTNIGTVTWTYSIADSAFSFLPTRDTLTLTYMVEVDTNYPPSNLTVFTPLTITITISNRVTWIHPTGGFWSVGSNWDDAGQLPTASDDVIIPAQHIPGGTGFYPVTIAAPALAHTVTLDAANTTGAEIINESSFTVGGAVTLFNDAVLNNQGAASFGRLELFNQSSVLNSGAITLLQGGDFQDQSTVVNERAAIIELAGGTLNVSVDINNSGLVKVDGGAVLNLEGAGATGAFQIGGVLNLEGASFLHNGSLSNAGQVNVGGAVAFSDESVINSGPGTINVTDELILENGTSVIGGALRNSGTVFVEASTGATLDAVNVSNANSGSISVVGGAALDLVNTAIVGGTLTGPGKIATAVGNSDSTLNGVTIAAGTTVAAAVGTLDLSGIITNHGAIDAALGAAIDMENVTLNGGTLAGPGTIATVSGLNTLSGVTIASGTIVNVTDHTVLDLEGTIVIAGMLALSSSGDATALKISGNVSLDGGGQVTLTDNIDNFIASGGSAATLNNFDTITGAGTIGDANLTLVNYGTIDANGSHTLTIDTGINTMTRAGLVGSLLVTNSAGGVLEAPAGHNLQIDDNVLNLGLIEAGSPGSSSGAAITITGGITGTGSIEIFDNSKLEIGGSVSSGQTVTFGAPGGAVALAATLILDDSHHFGGTIAGLIENDTEAFENHVDLKDLKYIAGDMSADFTNGKLTVSNGTDSVTLKISGLSSGDFEFAPDATGGTLVDDPPASGTVAIDSNTTLSISGATTATVNFANNHGNTGELVINKAADFTGTITGFTGDGTPSNSDLIDLKDINFGSLNKENYIENGAGTGGTLTLSDGTRTASINFSGNYAFENFKFASDGHGGTLVIDPPVPTSQSDVGTEWHDSHGTGQIWHGIASLVAEAHNAGAGEISPMALLHAQLVAQHNGFHFF
jgi:hypothetical protein